MIVNSLSLFATTLLTALLGLAYWAVAARLFEPAAVGYASSALSAMTLLGTIGMFGLGMLLVGELGRAPRASAFAAAALIAAGAASAVLGIAYVAVAPLVGDDVPYLEGSGRGALFVVGVALTAVTLVVDNALIGVLRGGQQLWRNATFAVAKLGLLFPTAAVFHDVVGVGVIASWVAGLVVSLAGLAASLSVAGVRLGRPDWPRLRLLRSTGLAHYWLDLAFQAPRLVLPVLATPLLTPDTAAAFFVALVVAMLIGVAPVHLCTVLFAVGSARPDEQRSTLRFTLRASWLIGIVGVPLLVVLAHPLLSVFGSGYADQGTRAFQILALGYFPTVVKVHYIAIGRLTGRLVPCAAVVTVVSLAEIVGAVALAHRGIDWFCGGLVGVMFVATLVFLPTVERFRRHGPSGRQGPR